MVLSLMLVGFVPAAFLALRLINTNHESMRDHTFVIVEGHSPKNWGVGGRPWPVEEMEV